MGLLKMIGLMTVAEHEALSSKADDAAYNSWIKVINERDFYVSEFKVLEGKFKRAATDLAAQAQEIAALRPDAQSWRNRQERERQRGERRKGKG